MKIDIIDTDVLIIGSGIAGLMAAITILKAGKSPLLITKSRLGKATNTILSGGGFAVATQKFDPQSHFERTIRAGRLLNEQSLVRCFVEGAPEKIAQLRRLGLKGRSHDTGFKCSASALIGGPHLADFLAGMCRNAGLNPIENVMVTDLVVEGGKCSGAVGFHRSTGEIVGVNAKAVMLATGGAGAIYLQNDNAPGAMGDGYALALRAGLELLDMEFVQFYPLHPVSKRGGNLSIWPYFADLGPIVNRQGENIKEKYALNDKPVAIVSRDRLSQAVFKEISEGNHVDHTLLLDLRKVDESKIPLDEDLKAHYKKMLAYDKEPVRIIPVCHHTMGGIEIDAGGRTRLKGLFAAGEVVGGIHGANRMGGNALSEGLVFGERCAQSACEFADNHNHSRDFEGLARDTVEKRFSVYSPVPTKTGADVQALTKKLKGVMWNKVGIIRQSTSLREAVSELEGILDELKRQKAKKDAATLARMFACESGALIGKAIAVSALERTESRGSHYRDDFPQENPQWLKHIYVKVENEKVLLSRISPVDS
ncbi:MAG: FAD-binding protein [Desulfobacterales bacterium]|nr:FAD-binding protein [Desulfobacterales bacterium]